MIKPGDLVTLEQTLGLATSTPETRVVTGRAFRDDEGTLRVQTTNVTRDARGQFPAGVVILTVNGATT